MHVLARYLKDAVFITTARRKIILEEIIKLSHKCSTINVLFNIEVHSIVAYTVDILFI